MSKKNTGKAPALPLTRWRYFCKTLYSNAAAKGEFSYEGVTYLKDEELRAIEERMRDAFARFDFTQVRAAGADIHEGAVAEACSAKVPRSVFSLAGLAEGHCGFGRSFGRKGFAHGGQL